VPRGERGSSFFELVALAVVLLVAGAATVAFTPRPAKATTPRPPGSGPGPTTAAGYVSSAACLPCHPGEHASFRRTYHRTMTQRGGPGAVVAEVDGKVLERRGDEIWAAMPEPPLSRPVVLTTGSHREQAYWVKGKRPGDLELAPRVWLVRERVFVPRREAFLRPDDEPLPRVRWSSSCIACHAVAGEPRHDIRSDGFDTRVAELGVACEACHGPGAAHVERHRDPVERWAQRGSNKPDPTIVHPGKLPPEGSAAVCGQCHAYAFPKDEDGWWTLGYSRSFRAGDALEPSRTLLSPVAVAGVAAPVIDAPAGSIFWPDGSVRVGGREYNGLVRSPCFERGAGARKMTCLSCHSMHHGDPEGQLAPDKVGDHGCTSCHEGERAGRHSHHAAGSPGASCVACHMAKTSYALLSAVRSHRIDSPTAVSTDGTAKPNACNLCHLDRSFAWTARWLGEWYGTKPPHLDARFADLEVGLVLGLAGDAAVRALVADALGTDDARAACRNDFADQVLGAMSADPYPAVRFIAARSRRSAPAPALDPTQVAALVAARDDRVVTIAE
jgi:hypothetical protein